MFQRPEKEVDVSQPIVKALVHNVLFGMKSIGVGD